MAQDNVIYQSVPDKEKNGGTPTLEPPKGFGMRHVQTLVLFISLTTIYSMRAHLGITMVAMTDQKSSNCSIINNNEWNSTVLNNDTVIINSEQEDCLNQTENSSWSVYRTYNWNKATQEMIMYSFFVGYTSAMIPMGIFAQKFGGKLPILIALGANGVISILTPWIALFAGWIGISMCRLLQGMTQAAFYPSSHTMLGKWAPLSERGRLCTYVYTGSQFGTVVAFQLSGAFSGSATMGWPSVFWFCGIASFLCMGLMAWLGSASPYEHPKITAEELAYITEGGTADAVTKKRKTPWKHIITSKPVWALVISHAGSAVGYLFLLTEIPLYMNKVLGVNIKKNGLYSSLPYIFMYLTTLVFGYITDYVGNKKLMSVLNIRRTSNTIALAVSSIFLMIFGFVNSVFLAVLMLVLTLSLHSGAHVGFHINHIDLAPNFAGPIMSLGNMIANLSSLIVPVLVSNIVGDDFQNQSKWQILFFIISGINIFTNTVFVIFAKGTLQPWNFYGADDEDSEQKEEMYALKEKNSENLK